MLAEDVPPSQLACKQNGIMASTVKLVYSISNQRYFVGIVLWFCNTQMSDWAMPLGATARDVALLLRERALFFSP